MTKPRTSAPSSANGNAAPGEQPTFRSNPEVDAKIDAYIKENPKYWTYVQAMPRERLERSVVLNEVIIKSVSCINMRCFPIGRKFNFLSILKTMIEFYM